MKRELIGASVALGGVLLSGTLWYWLVEKWSFVDSAYMTIITLSTVGFGEIKALDAQARIFTMVLILTGIVIFGYLVNRFTEAISQGYFKERLRFKQKRNVIDKLQNHYILCGFGRMGFHVARELHAENTPFIILEKGESELEKAEELGYLHLQGDATLDESLLEAKVETALAIIAALSSDADNLYTVISAKALNPNIRAIARANSEEAVKKLERGGADAVVSPYVTGGKRLAAAALRPQIMDFVDGILSGGERAFYLEEFLLPEDCPCRGQSLREAGLRARSGALVVAIRSPHTGLIPGPNGESILTAGDSLICMGTGEQLRTLNSILAPMKKSPRQPRK
ncbi:potassium channel protein [Cyanobacterium stanieri LEGE 03274]|uniref:Potassium channel protein n=1 Tax=Cyanobacterium stanieri LEGE 03274 TaxID=1828756 RepID=A0ABR9V8G4_9CHRO|nr:potassium channel protein [Cyanobacterium stanieri]MBE9223431.1 potassium channel protein [Cyanobacterium stanieri LEGE 03274]